MKSEQIQSHYLAEFKRERSIDLAIRGEEFFSVYGKPATSRGYSDMEIEVGQVRLLSRTCLDTPEGVFVYVLVLGVDDEVCVVVPFSQYQNPATSNELLTGFNAAVVRVLQVWATTPVSRELLSRSWVSFNMTPEEVEEVGMLYKRFNGGTPLPEGLEKRVGPDHIAPPKVVMDYQEEVLDMFRPLTTSAIDLVSDD